MVRESIKIVVYLFYAPLSMHIYTYISLEHNLRFVARSMAETTKEHIPIEIKPPWPSRLSTEFNTDDLLMREEKVPFFKPPSHIGETTLGSFLSSYSSIQLPSQPPCLSTIAGTTLTVIALSSLLEDSLFSLFVKIPFLVPLLQREWSLFFFLFSIRQCMYTRRWFWTYLIDSPYSYS